LILQAIFARESQRDGGFWTNIIIII